MSQAAAEKRPAKPALLKDRDFQWEDPLGLEFELTEEERMVRDTAKGFAQDYLMPRITEAYLNETHDPNNLKEMGKLGQPAAYFGHADAEKMVKDMTATMKGIVDKYKLAE